MNALFLIDSIGIYDDNRNPFLIGTPNIIYNV